MSKKPSKILIIMLICKKGGYFLLFFSITEVYQQQSESRSRIVERLLRFIG